MNRALSRKDDGFSNSKFCKFCQLTILSIRIDKMRIGKKEKKKKKKMRIGGSSG